MKTTSSTLFLSTAILSLAVLASAASAEHKNLLFYGNSFTGSGGGVHLLVRDIATLAGHETPHVYGRVVGGQTLEYHLATGTSVITSGIPQGQQWDAVVLQEYSTRPTTHPSDGDVPAFLSSAQGLYQAVLDHSAGAQAVLFETWARAPGHSVYPGIWDEPAEMQSELRTNYALAQAQLNPMGFAEVASVGDAFEAGGFDVSLYGGDLYHASNTGAMVAALVLYGTIYDDANTSAIDLSVFGSRLGLSNNQLALAAQLADSVLVPAPAGFSLLLGIGLVGARRRR